VDVIVIGVQVPKIIHTRAKCE